MDSIIKEIENDPDEVNDSDKGSLSDRSYDDNQDHEDKDEGGDGNDSDDKEENIKK